VLTSPDQTERYLTDWRDVFHGSALAVIRPANSRQVSEVVAACVSEGVAIVPQGGNTGLAAGATPLNVPQCIILSLERMNNIRVIDPEGYTLTVEAGCVLSVVQDAAHAANRFFPLSLAAEGSAQIGGLISTNAGGTSVVRYGSMRALVLGIEAVLPNGETVDGLRALRKDNAGYDWKQLLIGAEGTLGIVTAATLRLFPLAKHGATALFAVDSPAAAVRLFSALYETLGETLSACELMPDVAIVLRLSHNAALKRPMAQHPWYVLVEAASSLGGIEEGLDSVFGLRDGVIATSAAQEMALWEWRESITESEKRAGPSAKHDVSVPISSIPPFMEEATAAVERDHPGCKVLAFGHLGDGNIHFNVFLNDGATAEAVNQTVHAIVAKYRGSITAEHGIGRYRASELPDHRSASEMALMRSIKHAVDPKNLMNPGAVLL
jgi:FAD/FMN-containing dehydrogenase